MLKCRNKNEIGRGILAKKGDRQGQKLKQTGKEKEPKGRNIKQKKKRKRSECLCTRTVREGEGRTDTRN